MLEPRAQLDDLRGSDFCQFIGLPVHSKNTLVDSDSTLTELIHDVQYSQCINMDAHGYLTYACHTNMFEWFRHWLYHITADTIFRSELYLLK